MSRIERLEKAIGQFTGDSAFLFLLVMIVGVLLGLGIFLVIASLITYSPVFWFVPAFVVVWVLVKIAVRYRNIKG